MQRRTEWYSADCNLLKARCESEAGATGASIPSPEYRSTLMFAAILGGVYPITQLQLQLLLACA